MGTASKSTFSPRWVGDFEIIRAIGRGGIAVVYLARQASLDRHVALKELGSFQVGSPDTAERFVRESRIAASLNHPNIATVFEYFEYDDIPYIAMEYLQRGSLRPYVGRLELAQFVGVMEGILAGLAHAQGLGIVHRDLKPENLLVTDEGRVKIADFRIAKATQTARAGAFLTTTGTTVGTPTYMAPEQAMAQPVGSWTDLYSVGVMAWEHIVGRVPFHDAEAPMVVVMRHINEQIPPAADVNPDVDPEVSGWIDRLLAKDPRSRPQDPAAVWDELEEIAIRQLGPKWRNDARLPTSTQILNTPPPLTPAPFESRQGPAVDPAAANGSQPATSYVTFERNRDRRAPAASATALPEDDEHLGPDTEEEQLTLPPARAPGRESEPPSEPTAPPEPDGGEPTPSASAPSAPSTGPAESSQRAPRRLRAILSATALGAAAAAVAFAGTALTSSDGASAPRPRTVSSGPVAISLPADWQRGATGSLPGLTLADELVVRPEATLDQLLAVGLSRTTDATLLPDRLLATLPGGTATGQVVRLNNTPFYRYRDLRPAGSGQVETVYALPTTTGTLIATCVSDQPSSTFTAACEQVVATVRVTPGHPLSLGPRADYGTALQTELTNLNRASEAEKTGLSRARAANAQAGAVEQLGVTYHQAAVALAKIDPNPAETSARTALTNALTGLSAAYGRLAHAAADNDVRAYDGERNSIAHAQTTLETALVQLEKFGYRPRGGHSSLRSGIRRAPVTSS